MTNIKHAIALLVSVLVLLTFLSGCSNQEEQSLDDVIRPIAEKSDKNVDEFYLDKTKEDLSNFLGQFSNVNQALESADLSCILNEPGNLVLALAEGYKPILADNMKFVDVEEIERVSDQDELWYRTYTTKAKFSYEDGTQTYFSYMVKDDGYGLVSVVSWE